MSGPLEKKMMKISRLAGLDASPPEVVRKPATLFTVTVMTMFGERPDAQHGR
jgi:hypothetical protein